MKTTITVGSSWHLFKEHLWRNPEMTGTGSLRGGLTTRAEHCKETFFPALCPRCTVMTSPGKAACGAPRPAVIPARGTYQPLITKIIRLHLQHSSQHRLWSGNWSPGLFDCVMRVRINRGSLGFLEEGTGMREVMHGWGGLMSDSAQLRAPLLAYLCTQGASVFTQGSLEKQHGDWQLLFRKWQRNVAAHRGKCSFTHASAEEMVSPSVPPPSSPGSRRAGHNKWSRNWCYCIFVKLVVVLEA